MVGDGAVVKGVAEASLNPVTCTSPAGDAREAGVLPLLKLAAAHNRVPLRRRRRRFASGGGAAGDVTAWPSGLGATAEPAWLALIVLAIIRLAWIVHWAGGGIAHIRLGHFSLDVGFT